MRNIAPSRELSRRQRQFLSFAFFFGAVGVFLIAAGIFMNVVALVVPSNPSYNLYVFVRSIVTILGIGALIAGIALAARALTLKMDNDLAQRMAQYLAPALNDDFVLVRNVSKREIGYVDAVLVGPPGVLVFRLIDRVGIFANDGINWMQQKMPSGEWTTARMNPTVEAQADVRRLGQYLANKGLQSPVFGTVVFTNDPPAVTLIPRNPQLIPTTVSYIMASLQAEYFAGDRIPREQVDVITRLLLE
jgi:hypothetical protein